MSLLNVGTWLKSLCVSRTKDFDYMTTNLFRNLFISLGLSHCTPINYIVCTAVIEGALGQRARVDGVDGGGLALIADRSGRYAVLYGIVPPHSDRK